MPARANRQPVEFDRRRRTALNLDAAAVAEGVAPKPADTFYPREVRGRTIRAKGLRRIPLNLSWPGNEADGLERFRSLVKLRGWTFADDIMAMMELVSVCQDIAEHNEQMTIILAELGLERRIG